MDNMNFINVLKTNSIIYKDKQALIYKDEYITFGELYRNEERIYSLLQYHGVKKGDIVLLYISNPIIYVCSFYAILHYGGIALPSGSLKDYELKKLIQQYEIKNVIVDEYYSIFENDKLLGEKINVIVYDNLDNSVEKDCHHNRTNEVSSLGVIHLTSGSSGKSKGVLRNIENLYTEAQDVSSTLKLSNDDVILCSSPLFHSFACGFMRAAMLSGTTLVVTKGFEPSWFLEDCEKYHVSIALGVPYLLQGLVELDKSREYNLTKLKMVITGGVSLPIRIANAFYDKYKVPLVQEYGLSEGGIVSINSSNGIKNSGSVGRPIDNVQVLILNENMEEVEKNCIGEIAVKRKCPPKMYYNMPELSREVFIRDDLILTGDLGKVDNDGYLYIMGRKKLMINVAGNKVDPAEIENLLLLYPKIAECVVLGEYSEQQEEIVKAIVVSRNNMDISIDEILSFCRANLSTFKVPRKICITDKLPRSASGKVLKSELLNK
jgi:long-chain acyl-CoA synthetase